MIFFPLRPVRAGTHLEARERDPPVFLVPASPGSPSIQKAGRAFVAAMGGQNEARESDPLFLSTAAPQRDLAARAEPPEMLRSEAMVAISNSGRRSASPEDFRGLPRSENQEIIGWSRRSSLAMASPCGASDEGILFSPAILGLEQGIRPYWSQVRPSSSGAASEAEELPAIPQHAAHSRRHPAAASAWPPAASDRATRGFDTLVSPSTVLGLEEGGEGGSQRRECGGDALLSPDSVFEMDMQRGCESAPGEVALPWAPSQRTLPCA